MVLTDNLQLFLDGEENSSDTEYYGVTGTVDGLSFDGINDYVDLGDTITFVGETTMSMSVWVKADSLYTGGGSSDGYPAFLWKADGAGGEGFALCKDRASNTLRFFTNFSAITTTLAITTDTWYHIVATWDGTTKKIYVNDNLEASGSFSTPIADTSLDLCIGRGGDGSNYSYKYWDGNITNINIYDTALSTAEITALYNKEEVTSGRVYHNSGKTLTDESNHNSLVTLSGAVTSDDGFVFDGTNDKVTASSTILGLGDKSGSFKIKFDTLPEYGYIMGNEQVGLSGFDTGFELYTVGTTMSMMIGKAAAGHYLTCGATVTTGVEYIFTWKQESNQLFMYKDNVLFASDLISDGTEGAGSVNFHAGVTTNGLQMFDGVLSDIALYDKALSTEEITALSNDEEITDSRVFFHNGKALNSKSTAHNGVIVNSDGEYEFDGTNDYIDTSIIQNTPMSFTSNVYLDNNNYAILFGSQNAGTSSVLYLGTGASGVMQINIRGDSGGIQQVNGSTLPESTWVQVGYVLSDTHVILYVNGTEVANVAKTWSGTMDLNGSHFIGSRNLDGTASAFGDGKMDNITIYDKALSSTEITELYNNGGSPIITSSGKLIFGVEMTKVNGISFIKMNGV